MSSNASDARKTAARDALVSLMTVFGTVQQQLKNRMREQDSEYLGPLHMRLLCMCLETPGLTQQQLANRTGRDKGQVSHLIHALEKLSLMARTLDPSDGRILRMSVTAAGAKQAEQFIEVESAVALQLLSRLDAGEIQRLQAVAKLMGEGIGADPH